MNIQRRYRSTGLHSIEASPKAQLRPSNGSLLMNSTPKPLQEKSSLSPDAFASTLPNRRTSSTFAHRPSKMNGSFNTDHPSNLLKRLGTRNGSELHMDKNSTHHTIKIDDRYRRPSTVAETEKPLTARGRGSIDTLSSVEKTMEDSFQQYLQHRTVQKQRIRSASTKVAKKEEEQRQIMKKKLEEKEKKKQAVLQTLVKKSNIKVNSFCSRNIKL